MCCSGKDYVYFRGEKILILQMDSDSGNLRYQHVEIITIETVISIPVGNIPITVGKQTGH